MRLLLLAISAPMIRALTTAATPSGKRAVLALHGKGGDAESFRTRLAPLIEATEETHTWCCACAPFEMSEGGGYQWWTLPPGVRSFNAPEFQGVLSSIQHLQELSELHGPFDAILGHSQGAMLTAILLALQGETTIRPKAAVLTGAAWPNPFSDTLEALSGHESRLPPTLHCIGDADTMNPPEQARRLAALFRGETLSHPGGHVVPLDDTNCARIARFLVENT